MGAQSKGMPFAHETVSCAREASVVGTKWLLRDVELARITAGDVELQGGHGCCSATLHIPTSNGDWRAKGCKRTLDCSYPEATYPVAALRRLTAAAREWSNEAGTRLVHTTNGEVVTKEVLVQAIRSFAVHGGNRAQHIAGHSMRTTGAQLLAATVCLRAAFLTSDDGCPNRCCGTRAERCWPARTRCPQQWTTHR